MRKLITILAGTLIPTWIIAQEPIRLLMRADDMGITHDINMAIIKSHKEGLITSASIMPTSNFFDEAIKLCKANPTLVTGVHITLSASKLRTVLPPDEVPHLVTPAGFLHETAEEMMKESPSEAEMEKEIRAQIEKVSATGLRFTYIDWHRGATETIKKIILKICDEQKLIYGQESKGEVYGYHRIEIMPETWPHQFLPDGQRVYYAAPAFNEQEQRMFYDNLRKLGPGNWITAMHPGLNDPQRTSVTGLICSPEAKEIIKEKNIRVISYKDIWNETYGKGRKKQAGINNN